MGAPVPVHMTGREHIDAAQAAGQGLLFFTPHMGCFEITARAYAELCGQAPGRAITVLFRPPRQTWLRQVVAGARQGPGLETAPTTLAGVKQLLKALRSAAAVGLLPDQVPPEGQGVWAPFFGRPAYTMTLSARLAQTPRTTVLLVWGERLSWGRGYRVHVSPWDAVPCPPTPGRVHRHQCRHGTPGAGLPAPVPVGYARYKTPRGGAE
jgi:KDO2-lipid IV(A) lauroyltransferase